MERLTKGEFMKKVKNDYYGKRLKARSKENEIEYYQNDVKIKNGFKKIEKRN